MSYKERILRVRQLVTMSQLEQHPDSAKLTPCTSFDIPETSVPQSVDAAWKFCNSMPHYSLGPTPFIGSQAMLTTTFEQPRLIPSISPSYNEYTNITDMYLTFDGLSIPNDSDSVPEWVKC